MGSKTVLACLAVIFICLDVVSALTTTEKSAFAAEVTLTEDGDVYNFFSSGFPSHDVDNSVNPNEASVQNYTYNITINPNNEAGVIYCTNLGPVGFATNGVAIYNALTGDATDAVVYETFDDCKGHSSPGGSYHYHQFSGCIGGDMDTADLFVGIAIDGNPIYGPTASDKTEKLKSADLDACHGRYVGGLYRYHITEDFPYVIGCFRSEPAESNLAGPPGGGQGPPPGGRGPPGGGPPPNRKKRQTATCTNTEYGAELCDCTSGTLVQADTLLPEDINEDDVDIEDDPDNGVGQQAGCSLLLTSLFMIYHMFV